MREYLHLLYLFTCFCVDFLLLWWCYTLSPVTRRGATKKRWVDGVRWITDGFYMWHHVTYPVILNPPWPHPQMNMFLQKCPNRCTIFIEETCPKFQKSGSWNCGEDVWVFYSKNSEVLILLPYCFNNSDCAIHEVWAFHRQPCLWIFRMYFRVACQIWLRNHG